jgi:hypothetical protein
MWDTVAQLPAMFEEWDALKLGSPSPTLDVQAMLLKRRCYNLEMKLLEWHNDTSTRCLSFTAAESNMLRKHIDTLGPEDLPDILLTQGTWHLFAWMMHWAARIIMYSTTALIYSRFPPSPTEQIVTPVRTMGSYCLGIARSVKHFLGPEPLGLMNEMAIRIPVAVVQKILANEQLRATGDPKLTEAEIVLQNVGKAEVELTVRESMEPIYRSPILVDETKPLNRPVSHTSNLATSAC